MEYITFNDGNTIPMLGYGVFGIPAERTADCVSRALACGYRHIDAAQIYGNEEGVGEAISSCGLRRSELFVTSKVWVTNYGFEKTLKSVDQSLKKLKLDYIDLMLVHRPFFDYKGAWKGLERAREEGKVRSIGVSNFNEKQTRALLKNASVLPAVNQIEAHPYFVRKELKNYLAEQDIATEAWYPLGHGDKKLLGESTFVPLAEKYGKTPSQIILRWHIQRRNIVFPKATSDEHMRENLQIFDFSLSEDELSLIDGLDRGKQLFGVPDWVQKLGLIFGR